MMAAVPISPLKISASDTERHHLRKDTVANTVSKYNGEDVLSMWLEFGQAVQKLCP